MGYEPALGAAPRSPRRAVRRVERASAPVNASERGSNRNLPLAVAANLLVFVLPAVAVWAFAPGSDPAWSFASVSLTVALSVATASLGSALWTRRSSSGELVFSDLMLWGWLRRVRAERRLVEARNVLVPDSVCEQPRGLLADRHLAALTRLSGLIDEQDPYTRGHSLRVTRHAEGIARAMHLPTCEVAKLRTAAALHDVGKIHTPRAILHKPGRLSDGEFEVMKRHPGEGADMLSVLDDPSIAAMVRHHHERLDGSGYPDRLVGEAIPLGARIIAVADTFDAMTSNRSYRGAFEHKKALDVLSSEAGSRLDAATVSAFHTYYSGRRLAAWSALLTTAPPRLLAWLGGGQQVVTAAAPTLGKALPAIGAAALLSGPVGGSAVSGENSVAGRSASSPASQIADAGASARRAPGAGSVGSTSLEEPALRAPMRSVRSNDRVRLSLKRRPGETDGADAGSTESVRSVPRADLRGPGSSGESNAPAMPARDPVATPLLPVPLPEAPRVESPGVEPPAAALPATVGEIVDPPIPLPAVEAADIEIAAPVTGAVDVSITPPPSGVPEVR